MHNSLDRRSLKKHPRIRFAARVRDLMIANVDRVERRRRVNSSSVSRICFPRARSADSSPRSAKFPRFEVAPGIPEPVQHSALVAVEKNRPQRIPSHLVFAALIAGCETSKCHTTA
jgi:hypothetical protein